MITVNSHLLLLMPQFWRTFSIYSGWERNLSIYLSLSVPTSKTSCCTCLSLLLVTPSYSRGAKSSQVCPQDTETQRAMEFVVHPSSTQQTVLQQDLGSVAWCSVSRIVCVLSLPNLACQLSLWYPFHIGPLCLESDSVVCNQESSWGRRQEIWCQRIFPHFLKLIYSRI